MKEIKITKKDYRRGADGYKIVSVRMRTDLIERIEDLSNQTNRSRNELINLLLEAAVESAAVAEDEPQQ